VKVTVQSKGQIVIPGSILKQVGLERGGQVRFEVAGDRIILELIPSRTGKEDGKG